MMKQMNKIIAAFVVCGAMVLGLSVPLTTNVEATTIHAKKAKESTSKLEIVDSGYFVEGADEYSDTAYVYFWAKLKNNDKKRSIDFPVITATAKDDSGKVLGSQSQIGISIAPKDTVVLTSLMDTGDAAASSVEIKAKEPKFTTQKVVNSKNFTTANITEVPQEYTCPKVTGEVTYNGKEDLDGIAITAVYKLGDKSVYAYTTYLQSIESGSTESFEINPISTELPDHDSVDVYVQNW